MIKKLMIVGLAGVVLLAFSITLSGCSGTDALSVHNNYAFAIRLRYKDGSKKGQLVGAVSAHSDNVFAGAAGYNGGRLNQIKYENEQGKTLGTLRDSGPNEAKRGNASRFNGSATWSVSVGP